jgi:hypothetical protein
LTGSGLVVMDIDEPRLAVETRGRDPPRLLRGGAMTDQQP